MPLVSEPYNMLTVKLIVYPLILANVILLITATTKSECRDENDDENSNEMAYRFLNNSRALRYQVYLDPCISDGNFSGYVNVDLLVLESTKNLTLHSRELVFCEEGVYLTYKGTLNATYTALKPVTNAEHGGNSLQESDETLDDNSCETVRPCEFIYYKKEQTVTLKFHEYLTPGRYTLEINYMGTINTDAEGLYRKVYKDIDGDNRVMLLTNLYPTSARRVFPCRDDPSIKSEIYVTMQTSLNYTTLMANTPDNFVEYREGQRWSHYHPIVNTSTYQVNVAVLSNMKNVTSVYRNKTFIVYGVNPDVKSAKLILDTYERAMDIMENYTKVNYPLDTFINLVIPEKIEITSSSNLGFVTTKKSRALYDESMKPQTKSNVVLQATRDIAGQWFNQLITPRSWKYMWLNEGLTEYMRYHLADKIMPDWGLKDIFVVWELQRRSFIPNKITDGPALIQNVTDNPKDVECLLSRYISTTSMSASLIRMMSHFLSLDVLETGISNFLTLNKHKSVTPDDFWEAVQLAVNASKDLRIAKINVSEIMNTWINTEFYPVVKVTRNYTTGGIEVTQTPAVTFFGLSEKNVTHKWSIPINYATRTMPDFNTTFPSHWLKPTEEKLIIDGVDIKDWVIFNVQQTGYYRVLYDEENWERLASLLNSDDYCKIPPINRAQIINDAVQFSLKRQLNMKIFLNILSYLQRETNYIPWYNAQFVLSFLNYHLSNTQAYDSFKNFSLRLITPLVDKIGYEDRPDDDFQTILLRRISNHWACHFGYEKCWNNATKKLEAYFDNKTFDLGTMDLQEWAQCIGLNGADETIWNKMYNKYKDNLSEDTLIYLACSKNLTILYRLLDTTIANDSIIPEKQVISVFKSVCLYPSGDDKRLNLCLNFIDEKFNDIKLRFGNTTETFTYLLDLLASEIRQKTQLDQFQKLLSQEKAAFVSTKLGARMKQTVSRVTLFEQKANYYEPFLNEQILKLSNDTYEAVKISS